VSANKLKLTTFFTSSSQWFGSETLDIQFWGPGSVINHFRSGTPVIGHKDDSQIFLVKLLLKERRRQKTVQFPIFDMLHMCPSYSCKYVKCKAVFRIRIHVDPYWNGSPGSGYALRIRIRIQDSQNGVQNGKKTWDLKFKRAFTILLKAWWF